MDFLKWERRPPALFSVIVILSFFGILFAFDIIPISDLNDKPSFDIHDEIENLNEGRTNKYRVVESDWLELKQGFTGSDWTLFNRKNSWNDFKESLESNPPIQNILSLDENNRVIWYNILPITYSEY